MHARVAQNRRSGGRGGGRRGGGGGAVDAGEAIIQATPGLVIDINPKFDGVGPLTSVLDRKNGYVFNGTITRDAAINGTPHQIDA